MSVDQRLRRGLASIAADVTAEPLPALEIVQGRARRHDRIVRTVQVAAVAVALVLGMLIAVPFDGGRQRTEPVQAGGELEGTYVVDLADTAPNRRIGVVGRWVVTLWPDGGVDVIAPDAYRRPPTGATYRVDGNELRTNTFVDGMGCQAAGAYVGTYRWTRDGSEVRFVLVSDACPPRIALFTGQDWEAS